MSAAVEVRLYGSWHDVPATWHALARDGATAFHTPVFLSAWYDGFARRPGNEPLIVEACGSDGTPMLLMPLVLHSRPSRIGFIDESIVDNGAPILGPGAPRDAAGARELWRIVRAALPAADMVHLTRMPARIVGRPNPFALLAGVRPSRLSAHVIDLPEDFEAYRERRSKHFNKEQRRVARIFDARPDARFDLLETPQERRAGFAALEELQRARLTARGVDYRLDRPDIAACYARLIEDGAKDGSVILAALRAGETVVGALLGLRQGASVTVVRIAHAEGPWSRFSAGRMVIEKTMTALHARGVRRVDLSIGDYAYKDAFAAVPEPLMELAEPLRLAGWPAALTTRARARLSASPALRALARRLRGRPSEAAERAQRPG